MTLNPIKSTDEQIQHARDFWRDEWWICWWFGALLLTSVGAAIYSFVTMGNATGFLVPIGGLAVYAYIIWRFRMFRDIRSIERQFTIRDDGLVVEEVVNDQDTTKSVIPWTDVLFAKEAKGSVELRLHSGGRQTIPSECFSTDEQRNLLLQRANSASERLQ